MNGVKVIDAPVGYYTAAGRMAARLDQLDMVAHKYCCIPAERTEVGEMHLGV
jgi:hypothetical protein